MKMETVALKTICDIQMGQSPASTTYNELGKGLPFFQGKAEFGARFPVATKWCSEPIRIALSEDLLVSVRAPVGTVNLANQKCCIGRGLASLRFKGNPLYLYYYIQLKEQHLDSLGTGTTFRAINRNILESLEVPVPAERKHQDKIVEKIETLFSEIDAGIEDLKRAKANLDLYKQSVLNSVIQGKLVPQNPKDEPASILLERIRVEKEKLIKAGKLRKDKTLTPISDDELPFDLPKGWTWVRLGELLRLIEAGKSFKCDERKPTNGQIGVVKVSAVTWGEYDENESKTCTDEKMVNESFFVNEGDFLFSRANTIELVGAAVIARSVTRKIMLSDKILRLLFLEPGLKEWVLLNLRTSFGRQQIQAFSSGNQESMRNIGQDGIRRIIIPLPPMSIAMTTAEIFKKKSREIEKIRLEIELRSKEISSLKQSILKSAFEGTLV